MMRWMVRSPTESFRLMAIPFGDFLGIGPLLVSGFVSARSSYQACGGTDILIEGRSSILALKASRFG